MNSTITVGQKVRLQEPNWSGPGALKYTVVSLIDGDTTAILRRPTLPGLPESEGLIERPVSSVVKA